MNITRNCTIKMSFKSMGIQLEFNGSSMGVQWEFNVLRLVPASARGPNVCNLSLLLQGDAMGNGQMDLWEFNEVIDYKKDNR